MKDNFKNSVNEKDEEISRLKSLLSQRNYKIDELTENVGSLNHDLEVLSFKFEDNKEQFNKCEEIIQAKDDVISKKMN